MVKAFLQETALLAAKALANGGERETLMTTSWDISGNCSDPYEREVFARPNAKLVTNPFRSNRLKSDPMNKSGIPLRVRLSTRCRVCLNCRKAKANLWRGRMLAETAIAPRTWFITFTFAPEVQDYALHTCRFRKDQSSADFDELSAGKQFALVASELNRELNLYWKRLRKSGAQFRYAVVAEAHKSGRPHFHALLHEVSADNPLRHATMREQWGVGFIQIKLVSDKKMVWYLCKYLTKAVHARVRASIGYGKNTLLEPNQVMKKLDVKTDPTFSKTQSQAGSSKKRMTAHAELPCNVPDWIEWEAARLSTAASETFNISSQDGTKAPGPEVRSLEETFG